MNTAARQAHPLLGVALVVVASSCFAAMDSTVRHLGAFMALALLLWVRYTLHTLTMSVWIVLSPRKTFRTANPRFQIARGALLTCSSTMALVALQHMPVAEFTAIAMLTPLIATLLSCVWLREEVSVLRWALVVGGMVGALIIIRPGSQAFGWYALLPMGVATSNAVFQILTSLYAPRENAYTTNFYTGATGMVIATPLLLASGAHVADSLSAAPASQIGLLLAMAALGTAGHLLLIMALGRAPASTLMPFQYVQIAVAALCGWIAFNAIPDTWGWVGMAVVAACGAASAWLNVREAAARRRPITPVAADMASE